MKSGGSIAKSTSRAVRVFVVSAPLVVSFGACGSESPREPSAESSLTDDASSSSDALDGGASHSVVIREGRLEIDGKPTYLFGGEVQYFRVRDEKFDAKKTQELWRETFTKMRSANMNLVTTYFAWDYHHTGEGKWDFSGARDVDAYLDMGITRFSVGAQSFNDRLLKVAGRKHPRFKQRV